MVLSVDPDVMFPFERLRILPFARYSGAFNMAVDRYFAQIAEDEDDAVLRFYGWDPYCLSLGYHQDGQQVDRGALLEDGCDLVRRPTGGSAIFHSEELTYGLIVPGRNRDKEKIYHSFHYLLHRTLRQLGYPVQLQLHDDHQNYLKKGAQSFACFNRSAYTEITFDDKKVVGSAQKIYKSAVLQHGSILLDDKQNSIIRYLKVSKEAKQKYLDLLKKQSIALKKINNQAVNEINIAEKLVQEFGKTGNISIYFKDLTSEEYDQIQKYNTSVVLNGTLL
ncbi:MAG: hypothetical protein GF313_07715 [Caldithrix sp.]|nr:hypothetical protein [Caldithrix sp.]